MFFCLQRSLKEIEKYCKYFLFFPGSISLQCNLSCFSVRENKTSLTIDNFTFRRDAIYKEPFERIRAAKAGNHFARLIKPDDIVIKKVEVVKKDVDTVDTKSENTPPKLKVMAVNNTVLKVRAVAKKHTGKRRSDHMSSEAKKLRTENGSVRCVVYVHELKHLAGCIQIAFTGY